MIAHSLRRFPTSSIGTGAHTIRCHARHKTISALQASFRDPSSPFHIPPGTKGPESPHPHPSHDAVDVEPLEEARHKLMEAGFDPASFWEQRIVWGDQDSFQHVNNVRYVRFFESSRIQWMVSLGQELDGPEKAQDMIKGKGISLILKSIEVQFRRPVTYPDTVRLLPTPPFLLLPPQSRTKQLLIAYRPQPPHHAPEHESKPHHEDPATFRVTASAYSLTQRAFVAHSHEALVWYDYDKLRKCDPGEAVRDVVWGRAKKAS
ncbi:hypothetical protein Hypma_000240 [Hypsizygus marmoreus]|uniref:Thioesterase/thiol ester dehydrase-isomerase n=1 Tax=Hypsizygus marmoreus TaxID=39966 RepID=A0A369JFS8_HYPMA|nr:hypothetical protein Hypma_000240 [Hypsizygus marmoreus]